MRKLNAFKLLRYATTDVSVEAELAAGKTYLLQYLAVTQYGMQQDPTTFFSCMADYNCVTYAGNGLPATELRPADDFGLMAAQAWISAWYRGGETKGKLCVGYSEEPMADLKCRFKNTPAPRHYSS
jgi:hypothetical protein